jgi:hypothetical protein
VLEVVGIAGRRGSGAWRKSPSTLRCVREWKISHTKR